jgi:hypothetical protein
MSSEKMRVIILFAFFVALVGFAVTYSPTSALSRPAGQRSSVLPIGKPLQIKVPLGLPPPARTGRQSSYGRDCGARQATLL